MPGFSINYQQTLDNIKAVLEQFGSSLDKVVKCTLFLADIGEWGAMNEVYRTYFKNPSARSALGASGLVLGARVEIECIANDVKMGSVPLLSHKAAASIKDRGCKARLRDRGPQGCGPRAYLDVLAACL